MSLSRIYRLLQLVSLLESGRAHNADDLAALCEVSRRTIFRDFQALELAGVPVDYDPEGQGYKVRASFFLPPAHFTLDEALDLTVLGGELGLSRGLPFFEHARSGVLKLQSMLPAEVRKELSMVAEAVSIHLGPRSLLSHQKPLYRQLLRAIGARQKVRLTYTSRSEGETVQTQLSPYRVAWVHPRWYVIGRSSLHRAVATFDLGRIARLEPTGESYRLPPRFSLERYLGNAWTIVRGKPVTRVRIRFGPRVAGSVAEVQWHRTQRHQWREDGGLDFSVTVAGIDEIAGWVLGYGDQAEVLDPPELRDRVRRTAEALVRQYTEGSGGCGTRPL